MSKTVAEIRKVLKERHGYTDDQLKQGKKHLRSTLDNLEKESSAIEIAELADFDQAESSGDDGYEALEKISEPDVRIQPSMDSPDWSDYVMSQFKSDELEQGNPTCDGLRRLVEYLVGPISGRSIHVQQAPSRENYGTSTVICTVRVINNIEGHLLYGREISESDAADVNRYNTQEPYHLHPTATAATRAEARALRKILRLKKVIAVEELSGDAVDDYADAWKPNDPVEEEQINLIDIVCQRCNLNVMEYVNSGESAYNSIYEIDRNKAQSMIQHINKIQQEKAERPVGVGDYDSSWRKN